MAFTPPPVESYIEEAQQPQRRVQFVPPPPESFQPDPEDFSRVPIPDVGALRVPGTVPLEQRVNQTPTRAEMRDGSLRELPPEGVVSKARRVLAPLIGAPNGEIMRGPAASDVDRRGLVRAILAPEKKVFPGLTAEDIATGNVKSLLPGNLNAAGENPESFYNSTPGYEAPTWAKIAAGAQRAVARTADVVANPMLTAGFAISAGAPLLGRAASATFGVQMLKDLPDVTHSFNEAVKSGDVQGATEALVGGGLGAYFGVKALQHAGGPGIAKESPMVRRLLSKQITETFTPQQLKESFIRVTRGEGTPQEQELFRFVNEAFESPKEAIKSGVKLTQSVPAVESQFWRDYLGLEKGSKEISPLNKGEQNANRKQSAVPEAGSDQAQSVQTVSARAPGDVRQIAGTSGGQAVEAPRPFTPPPPVEVSQSAPPLRSFNPGPTMEFARQIADMTPEEYRINAQSFNKYNIPLGQTATPAEVEELKQLREKVQKRLVDLGQRLSAKAKPTDDEIQDYNSLSVMPQFFNEAIVEAAKRPAIIEKSDEKRLPTNTVIDPAGGYPVQEADVDPTTLELSHDVPQFKEGAGAGGEVEGHELKGKYTRVGTGRTVVWERLNGNREIVTGRHKWQLALRNKLKDFPVQIVREADGFTRENALVLDAESNIRDNQGSVRDYAHYFRQTAKGPSSYSKEAAIQKGLLRDAKGRNGWDIGRNASDDLYSIWRAEKVSDAQAVAIAKTVPGNPDIQALGIRKALEGLKPEELVGFLKSSIIETGGDPSQIDLFGNSDAALNRSVEIGKKAAARQREIYDEIRAVQGAAKNPTVAARHGVDVKDPEGVLKRIAELKAELEKWEHWEKHAELIAQLTAGEQKAKGVSGNGKENEKGKKQEVLKPKTGSPEKSGGQSVKKPLPKGQTEISRDQALAIHGGSKRLLPAKGETKPQPSDTTGEYFVGQTEDGRFFTEHKPKEKNETITDTSGRFESEGGIAKAAADHLRESIGTDQLSITGAQASSRQAGILAEWATKNGLMVDADALAKLPKLSDDTHEHHVMFDEANNQVIKQTWPGSFGNGPVKSDTGIWREHLTPLQYLERVALQNKVFGDTTKVIGFAFYPDRFMRRPGGLSIVTSQHFVQIGDDKNPTPSQREIDAFMEARGFESIPGEVPLWRRASDGVLVMDARADNFIKTKAGIVPIDLQIGYAKPVEKQAAKAKAGDEVVFVPSNKKQTSISGIVQDVIYNDEGEVGYHIIAPLPGDPSRTVRVWDRDGVISPVVKDVAKRLAMEDEANDWIKDVIISKNAPKTADEAWISFRKNMGADTRGTAVVPKDYFVSSWDTFAANLAKDREARKAEKPAIVVTPGQKVTVPAGSTVVMDFTTPKFKPDQKVMVGEYPMNREGTIAAFGPYKDGVHHYFVKTNLGETLYAERDIREIEKPKPAVRNLTKAEQNRFAILAAKARDARDNAGEPLTGAELREYQDLEKIAGAQDLLVESTSANDAAIEGEVKRLRAKAAELDRQAILTHNRANASNDRDNKNKLRKAAYDLDKEATDVRNKADELEATLKRKVGGNDLTLKADEPKPEKPAETVKEDDLFSSPKPTTVSPMKSETPKQLDTAPVVASAIKPAIIVIEGQGDTSDADMVVAVSAARNHFTLWIKQRGADRWGQWRYISILGKVKEDATARAMETAQRLAVGDLTGVAFMGQDQFRQPSKIAFRPTLVAQDELMGVDRMSVGEQRVGFGKYADVLVKDLFGQDAGYAEWLVGNASGKRGNQVADYIRELPEFIVSRDSKISEARDAVNDEVLALLKQFEISATPRNDGTIQLGGKTYDWKDTIKSFGGRFDNAATAWNIPATGFKEFVEKLKQLPKPGNAGRQRTGIPLYQRDTKLGDIRKASDARPDRSGFEQPISKYVGDDTAQLIRRGLAMRMPQIIVDEQIEDIAMMVRSWDRKERLFVLANEPGSGKTFVLGGAIREWRKRGANKIVYVTLRKELISQIKDDLKDYEIGDVEFITYPEMRKANTHDSDVLIFDEAHAIKNVNGEGDDVVQQAKAAAEWISKSKMTVLSSATPFENPVQVRYLEPTGVFGETFGTFENFALAHGASKRTFDVKTPRGYVTKTELVWKRTTTSDEDSKAAREFFRKLGVFTSRRIRLAPGMMDSRLVKVTANENIANIYSQFSAAAEELEDTLGSNAIMWVTNFQKRLLESSKVEFGMDEAQAAMKRGRWPILFVETKAERKIDIPDLVRREDEWARLAMVAMQNKDTPPPRKNWNLPPRGITEVLAKFMDKTGTQNIEIPSAEDLIIKRFGEDKVAIFTGSVTPKKAQENLDRWRKSKKPMIIAATMAKGGTGLSLHDKVGDHQTTQINVNLPWTATQVVQVAQRSARYGLVGQAEVAWIFADNIPFDEMLSARVGGRMADMGSLVQGAELKGASEIEQWDFEGVPFSEISETIKNPPPDKQGALPSELGFQGPMDDPTQSLGPEYWLDPNGKFHSAVRGHEAKANQILNRDEAGIKPGQNAGIVLIEKGWFRVIKERDANVLHAEGTNLSKAQKSSLEMAGIRGDWNVVAYDTTGSYPKTIYTPPQDQASLPNQITPVGQPQAPAVAKTLPELKTLVNSPASGLSKEAVTLINAFLDSPLADTLDGLTVKIQDVVETGWDGSYFQGVVELARSADPKAGVHEFLHRAWEVLPQDIKAEFERMRVESLKDELLKTEDETRKQQIQDLIDNPTTGTADFLARGLPRDLYELSRAEELFTHSGSDQFKAKVGSIKDGFWARVKEFIKDFIAALKKAFKFKQSQEDWLRNILNGRFEITPESGKAYEARQASLGKPDPIAEAERARSEAGLNLTDLEMPKDVTRLAEGQAREGVPTETFNIVNFVAGRQRLDESFRKAGQNFTSQVFAEIGIPVRSGPSDLFLMADPANPDPVAWTKMIDRLKKELAEQRVEGRADATGGLVNFLDSLILMWQTQRNAFEQMPPEIGRQLFQFAQGERSFRGLLLGAMAHLDNSVTFVGQNVDTMLQRVWSDQFNGAVVSKVMDRVLTEFKDFFTDEELKQIAADAPDLQQTVDEIIKRTRDANTADKVYQRASAWLKPKKPKGIRALQSDARVKEAVEWILDAATKAGVQPTKPVSKKMTPQEQLLHLLTPGVAPKIQESIENAFTEMEWDAAMSVSKPDDRPAMMEAKIAGEQPDPELVAKGLALPKFAKWVATRDFVTNNLLGYNPVTLKLVQDLVTSDFSGTKFGKPVAKPAVTKIDLVALAKSPDAEVKRVLDAYLADIEANMQLKGAPPELRQRIKRMIYVQVRDQIASRREEFINSFISPKKSLPLSASVKLRQLINAGISKDTRFQNDKVRQLVKKIAGEYTKDVPFESLATSTRAEKQQWMERKADEIGVAEKFSQYDEDTRAQLEATVWTYLAERLQAAEEGITRQFLRGNDVKYDRDQMTPEQRQASLDAAKSKIEGLVRAGAFDTSMVEAIGGKSSLAKLTPGLPELIKAALETPFYRQSELGEQFADKLVSEFSIDEAQRDKAKAAFNRAFGNKFKMARSKAADKAYESLTPQEKKAMPQRSPIWRKIERVVNADANFSTGETLRQIAKDNGWEVPNDEQIALVKDMSEQIQRLRELTAEESAAITDPALKAQAAVVKTAATQERRVALKRQIETYWARWTQPITLKSQMGRANAVSASYEFSAANLLFRLGFMTRQGLDVFTQIVQHIPTRSIGNAIVQHGGFWKNAGNAEFWRDAGSLLKQSIAQQIAAARPALREFREAMRGTAEAKNVDRLMSGIALFERMDQKAGELDAAGKHGQAFAMRFFGMVKFSYRFASALDNLQGVPQEWQEMRTQAFRTFRDNGMTTAEAKVATDTIIGDLKADHLRARALARQYLDATGRTPTKAELDAAAWHVVKALAYQRMRDAGMPADDFEERNRMMRSTNAWNEGIANVNSVGGVVANLAKRIGELGKSAAKAHPALMPIAAVAASFGRFGNAMGTAIDRSLTYTPIGLFPSAFGVNDQHIDPETGIAGKGSPWFRTREDRAQRKVEASMGTAWGTFVVAMVLGGLILVRNAWPKDKAKRDLWDRMGWKPGTVAFQLGDGQEIVASMTVGPMAMLRPYLAGAGALRDALDAKAEKQAKLNAEAEKLGLPPGQVKPLDLADMFSIAGNTMWASVMGGRTASGLVGSLTDYGTFNPSKTAAATVSPLLIGLPAVQEASRMAGVSLDANLATFADFLVPMPTSGARRVNLLGDPSGTPSDMQRIVQILTGGTYPGITSSEAAKSQAGYSALFQTGYRPPSINPNKAYAFDGAYRPMKDEELSKYTQLRGQYLKEELANLGDNPDERSARAAYQTANARALSEMGVQSQPRRTQPESQPASRSVPSPTSNASVSTPRFTRVSAGRGRIAPIRRLRTSLRSSQRIRPLRPLKLKRQKYASVRRVRVPRFA